MLLTHSIVAQDQDQLEIREDENYPFILGLPNELLDEILTALPTVEDAENLAITCRQLHTLLEPKERKMAVYRFILVSLSFLSKNIGTDLQNSERSPISSRILLLKSSPL